MIFRVKSGMEGSMQRSARVIFFISFALFLTWNTHAADRIQSINVRTQEIEPFSFCSVSYQGTFNEIAQALNALVGIMSQQNIAPSGDLIAVFNVYPNKEEIGSSINFDVGFPITAQVWPQPPIQKKIWEQTFVATAQHSGPYSGLGDMIDEMFDWIEDRGYVQDGPILARFLEVPSEYNQPRDYRTEIWVPIRKE
jgi:effector-binding domain-containing protein